MITNALLKNFLKKVTLLQFTKSAIEMFKVNNGLLVQVVSENFSEKHYNFRHQSGTKFTVDHVNTQTYGKQSVSYFGPKTWNSIPKEKKTLQVWHHSKLRSKTGNLSVYAGSPESIYNVQVLCSLFTFLCFCLSVFVSCSAFSALSAFSVCEIFSLKSLKLPK